jgi:Spy/CpxP family protein refolding chaperone
MGIAAAQQAPGPGQPPHKEWHPTSRDRAALGQMFWHRIQERLGLSDQQAMEIRTLLQNQRTAAQADFQALRTARRQLRELLADPKSDPGAIQTAAAQVKSQLDKLLDQHLQTQLAIRAKLTPEQWKQWTGLRAKGGWHRWSHRHGHRWHRWSHRGHGRDWSHRDRDRGAGMGAY